MKTDTQNRQRWLMCLALALITAAVYWQSVHHSFLDYDDQQYVTENPHVTGGLTASGLRWAFGFHAANWHPLTWLSHMLDCQLYGLNPAGHHLTSVLLHVANTVLLFAVLNGMTGAIWRSAFVAALFAWHPLHVESVAWVAERKDVLSSFFFILTTWAYGRYVREMAVQSPTSRRQATGEKSEIRMSKSETNPKSEVRKEEEKNIGKGRGPWSMLRGSVAWYVLALVLFTLGLMSKPMVVTLPFVLLLLDYWPLKRNAGCRIQRPESGGRATVLQTWVGLVVEKIPFFALSAIGCVLTFAAQGQVHAVVSRAELPISQRLGHALVSYAHYLGAMILPRGLAVFYPYQTAISAREMMLTLVVLLAMTVLAMRFAKRWPYLIVGWLWFLGTLVPVIGLVQVGDQAWADRYMYLPSIGLFILVVWFVSEAFVGEKIQSPNFKPHRMFKLQASISKQRAVLAGMGSVIAIALLIGTTVQLSYWKNTRTLFEHAERVTRNNHMAITLLGSLLARDGKLKEAIDRYHAALQIKPGYPEAQFFLGKALDEQGNTDEAIEQYRRALWYKPLQIQTHIFLGVALAKQKRFDEAAAHYQTALKFEPESAVAHNNLARLLHSQGRLDEAIEHYQAALKYDPTLAQAYNNLGALLLQKGNLAGGTAQLREALRLNPGNAETELNLALALNQQEKWSEAADLFGKTAANFSTDANAHYQFGLALQHLLKTREAMGQFASALLIRPDFPDALAALSWILATSQVPEFRNGAEAVRMAERACGLTARKDPRKLKTLAAAYAEAGSFREAMDTADTAKSLASASGRDELTQECEIMAATFKSAKPWRADF